MNATPNTPGSPTEGTYPKTAILCVGNMLMLDDGIGHAVYEELIRHYVFPDDILLMDLGCMTHQHITLVRDYDVVITVDAVESTGEKPGTVFKYAPEDMERNPFGTASLHDLKLADLFDSASLLGYSAKGICFGMQAENCSPEEYTVGLTTYCAENLQVLVDVIVAELLAYGIPVVKKEESREN